MPIVSSTIIEDAPQSDGRRWITERHVDQLGIEHLVHYMAAAATNTAPIMAARAIQIGADLAAAEVAANVAAVILAGKFAVITLNYSTAAQGFAALRAAFPSMTKTNVVFTGEFLSTLTSGQLQIAFGMTAGQVTTLQANYLTPLAALAASIWASVGA